MFCCLSSFLSQWTNDLISGLKFVLLTACVSMAKMALLLLGGGILPYEKCSSNNTANRCILFRTTFRYICNLIINFYCLARLKLFHGHLISLIFQFNHFNQFNFGSNIIKTFLRATCFGIRVINLQRHRCEQTGYSWKHLLISLTFGNFLPKS